MIRLNNEAFAHQAELMEEQRKRIEEQQRILQLFLGNKAFD